LCEFHRIGTSISEQDGQAKYLIELVRDCNCQSNSRNCRKVNIGRLLQETSRGMQAGHRFNLSEHATGADVELSGIFHLKLP